MTRREYKGYGFAGALLGAIFGTVGYILIRHFDARSEMYTALGGFLIILLAGIIYFIINRGIISCAGALIISISSLLFLVIGEFGWIVYESSIIANLTIKQAIRLIPELLQFIGFEVFCRNISAAICMWFTMTIFFFTYAIYRTPKPFEITK